MWPILVGGHLAMIDRLKRKVARWRDMASQLEQKHKGNERDYTYHAG